MSLADFFFRQNPVFRLGSRHSVTLQEYVVGRFGNLQTMLRGIEDRFGFRLAAARGLVAFAGVRGVFKAGAAASGLAVLRVLCIRGLLFEMLRTTGAWSSEDNAGQNGELPFHVSSSVKDGRGEKSLQRNQELGVVLFDGKVSSIPLRGLISQRDLLRWQRPKNGFRLTRRCLFVTISYSQARAGLEFKRLARCQTGIASSHGSI